MRLKTQEARDLSLLVAVIVLAIILNIMITACASSKPSPEMRSTAPSPEPVSTVVTCGRLLAVQLCPADDNNVYLACFHGDLYVYMLVGSTLIYKDIEPGTYSPAETGTPCDIGVSLVGVR